MSTSEALAPSSYGAFIRAAHWTTLALVAVEFGLSYVWDGSRHGMLLNLHKSVGITILLLTVLRLAFRATTPSPAPEPSPAWQRGLSHLVHALLYGFLIVEPVLGWSGSMLGGNRIDFYFLGDLPSFLPQDPSFGHQLTRIHKLLTNFFLALIGLHAAAALLHHFILRDGVLRRMV
jgi:cytochrome b561